jgi:2-polyprenyl-3-methyl-5-hydroxy-6-metoxy-1,4-benzoquinol methylase
MNVASGSIETEPVPLCPGCSAHGRLAMSGGRDYVCGLPGEWTFWTCPSCNSLWPNPRPVESALSLLYPQNYTFTRDDEGSDAAFPSGLAGSAKLSVLQRQFSYDSLEQRADRPVGVLLGRIFGALMRKKAGYTVRFLAKKNGGKLLDVGCGNGAFMEWMQRLGWEVQGIEVDPVAAQRAIDRGLTIHQNKVENVALPLAFFDAITLTHVAEHFFDPRKIFQILGRCLKPGGVIVSISPNPSGMSRRIFGNKWYALDPPRHLFLPTAAAYRLMLEPLGFEVRTRTSMRRFYWDFKESLSIASRGRVGAISDSPIFKITTRILATLFSCIPGVGEEVICYARKR